MLLSIVFNISLLNTTALYSLIKYNSLLSLPLDIELLEVLKLILFKYP